MDRRSFFGGLLALLAGALGLIGLWPKEEPEPFVDELGYEWRDAKFANGHTHWRNYTCQYTTITKERALEAWRRAAVKTQGRWYMSRVGDETDFDFA